MAAARQLQLTCLWLLTLLSLTGAVSQRRLLGSNSQKPQAMQVNLLHRDHPESPLSVSHTTIEDRYHATAARERARMASHRRGLFDTTGVEFNTSIISAIPELIEEYVMTLYFGTPPQKFFLIMDTGSNLVWVQCLPCIHCYNETNPIFDPSQSSTYFAISCPNCNQTLAGNLRFCNSLNTCEIDYAYGQAGSSYKGVLSTETISFNPATNDFSVPNILFGCMNNNTYSFGHVDGFVGFGTGAFSLPNQLSLLNSFDVFSYCLVPYVVSNTLSSTLVFGVRDETNDMQLVYTPILSTLSSTFYWVNMTGIAINGMDVDLSGTTSLVFNSSTRVGGTLFDSGTSYITLNDDVSTIVTQTLAALIPYPVTQVSNTLCYNTSGVQQVQYPNMTLHFAGLDSTTIADLELTAQNLFIPSGVHYDCLTVVSGGSSGNGIIGNIAQADHYVETDLDNMRIGWISMDCTLPL